jgi:hypothetical protein
MFLQTLENDNGVRALKGRGRRVNKLLTLFSRGFNVFVKFKKFSDFLL